jgi:Flp pilus assembly pilin Flp
MQDALTKTSDSANLAVLRLQDHLRELGERLRSEEEGQTAAEYIGIIVLVVAIVGFAAQQATGIGTEITTAISKQIKEIGK